MTSVLLVLRRGKRSPTLISHNPSLRRCPYGDRPPRLSRHFCVLNSPLDLPDAVLTGPAEALLESAAKLDEHGWCKEGIVYPVARLRVGNLLMPIREEALELRNGPQIPDLESQTRQVPK